MKLLTSECMIYRVNKITCLLLFPILMAFQVQASHISAGNITYLAQGNGQYLIRLSLYRDCSGIAMAQTENVFAYSASGCAPGQAIMVTQIPNTGQQLPVSSCIQGANCYEEYIYEGTSSFSSCSDWELFYTTCCRNSPDNLDNFNIPFNDFYISTTLDNSNYPSNNSPVFNFEPVATFCVNNSFYFDMGATDPDGNLLIYSLTGALGFDGTIKTPLIYNPPYSALLPAPGITALSMDSMTGVISFTPSAAGKFVIVVEVKEYANGSGGLIGRTIRDLQVNISANCNNLIPAYSANILSGGIQANCGDTIVNISLSANVQCGTIASDGSDFLVTDNSTGSSIPVSSASGNNCVIGLSNMVILYFSSPFNNGSFTISVKTGNDGNTLISECGMPMTTSNSATLTVSSNFSVTATATQPGCFPDSTGSITINTAGLGGPFTYSIDGTSYVNTNVFTGLFPGTYQVYVRSTGNCISNASVVINAPLKLTISVSKTDLSCYNLHNGTATVSVLKGTAPYAVVWSTMPAQSSLTAVNLTAANYVVMVTDAAGCTDSRSVSINSPDSIQLQVTGTDTICQGQPASLFAAATGGTGSFSYDWIPAMNGANQVVTPSQTTTYWAQATDANGCSSISRAIIIRVRPGISLVSSPDTSICEGNSTGLSVSATGGIGNGYQFAWNGSPGNTSGINVTPGITTSYTVTVSDGCTVPDVSKVITVYVNPKPIASFSADTTRDCFPLYGRFSDLSQVSSGNIVHWEWNFGDSNTATIRHPHHVYRQSGSFTVSLQVTTDKGCSSLSTSPDFINVLPEAKPVALFSMTPELANIHYPEIHFLNQSKGGHLFHWDFGDETGESGLHSPFYTFKDTGNFIVTLQVTNTIGCSATYAAMAEVNPSVSLFIPNAFTPDGDGINDRFEVKGEYIAEASLLIFNRWGQKIFESGSLHQGWDGTYKGLAAPAGAYSYLIRSKGADQSFINSEGTLLLLR